MQTNLSMTRDRLHFLASGRKLTVGSKRPGNLGVMNKSQNLPRSMGGTKVCGAVLPQQRPAIKPIAIAPAVRRQLSKVLQLKSSASSTDYSTLYFCGSGSSLLYVFQHVPHCKRLLQNIGFDHITFIIAVVTTYVITTAVAGSASYYAPLIIRAIAGASPHHYQLCCLRAS
ncbi:hypothetical protein DMENIID0001_134970 [Sergentomyia squamirostris]